MECLSFSLLLSPSPAQVSAPLNFLPSFCQLNQRSVSSDLGSSKFVKSRSLICRAVDESPPSVVLGDSPLIVRDEFVETDGEDEEEEEDSVVDKADDVKLQVQKLDSNSRRIVASILIEASLDSVWKVLTDYEKLADFIPGLLVSQLLEKREDGARLLQVGQQSLPFGLKFKAKGIVDVFENELEILSTRIRRDIDFKMIEGDFTIFEGKWIVEELTKGKKMKRFSNSQHCQSILSYVVNVQPKKWLPVGFVEGRLSNEIRVNLIAVRSQVISVMPRDICVLIMLSKSLQVPPF